MLLFVNVGNIILYLFYNCIFNCSLNIKGFYFYFVTGMNKTIFEEPFVSNINRKKFRTNFGDNKIKIHNMMRYLLNRVVSSLLSIFFFGINYFILVRSGSFGFGFLHSITCKNAIIYVVEFMIF